jgi:nicotinic acid mononucleotide adenylyltransferase
MNPPLLPATAVFGGSFNPPGLHHRRLAELLLQRFAAVLLVPCGFRADKAASAGWVEPGFRRRLVEAAFADLAAPADPAGPVRGRLEIDWSDLAKPAFTPTIELAARHAGRGELWFVAGADLFAGGARGKSQIQTAWKAGAEIWTGLNWACLARPGFGIHEDDLPPRHLLIEAAVDGSSSEIRRRLAAGEALGGLVAPEVARLLDSRRP